MAIAGCSQVAAKKSVYSRNPRETLSKEFQCHKARLHAQSGHAIVTKGASTFPSSRGSSAMDFFVVFLRQLSLDGRQCVGSGCQEFTVFVEPRETLSKTFQCHKRDYTHTEWACQCDERSVDFSQIVGGELSICPCLFTAAVPWASGCVGSSLQGIQRIQGHPAVGHK